MNKKEKEKQKVINELFHTELTHVRHLRVLETLFYIPMRNEHIMIKDDLDTLFPNLSEVSPCPMVIDQSVIDQSVIDQSVVSDVRS